MKLILFYLEMEVLRCARNVCAHIYQYQIPNIYIGTNLNT